MSNTENKKKYMMYLRLDKVRVNGHWSEFDLSHCRFKDFT